MTAAIAVGIGLLLALGALFVLWREFKQMDLTLQALWLSRVPVITALLLLLLPSMLKKQTVSRNLFILEDGWQIAIIGFMGALLSGSIATTLGMFARLIPARYPVFRHPRAPDRRFRLPAPDDPTGPSRLLLSSVLCLPLAIDLDLEEAVKGVVYAWFSGGFFVGYGILAVALACIPRIRTRNRPRSTENLPDVSDGWDWLRDGYRASHRKSHRYAFIAAMLLVGVYTVMADRSPTSRLVLWTPALASLLLIGALLQLLLSGLTFFFDRFRLPVLGIIITTVWVISRFVDAGHTFPVLPTQAVPPAENCPYEACCDRFDRKLESGKPLVVLCAAGGGIQASAWTAKVLHQLHQTIPGFHDEVDFMSSVSGGSVALLAYTAALQDIQNDNGVPTDQVFDASTRSSLESVAWGLLYKDLRRILKLAAVSEKDRGWALEQAWLHNMHQAGLPTPPATLRDLCRLTHLPGIAFNATIYDDASGDASKREKVGSRCVFSTVRMSNDVGVYSFLNENPDLDIPLVTAVRMAATFPYVSPIAYSRLEGDETHESLALADGGYFDSSGLATALNWWASIRPSLEERVKQKKDASIRETIFILVDGFPDTPPDRSGVSPWSQAVLGPISLMFSARSSTQTDRADLELSILEATKQATIYEFRPPLTLVKDGREEKQDPPLSWRLSRQEKQSVEDSWTEEHERQALALKNRLLDNGNADHK